MEHSKELLASLIERLTNMSLRQVEDADKGALVEAVFLLRTIRSVPMKSDLLESFIESLQSTHKNYEHEDGEKLDYYRKSLEVCITYAESYLSAHKSIKPTQQ